MTVWKKEGDFERAQKVEKTEPSQKARETSRKKSGRSTVAGVQSLLADLGYDPGPADGVIGPRSRMAIERYQAAAGLQVDGEVAPALLASLRKAHAAKQIEPEAVPEKRREEPSPVAQSIRTEIGEDGVMREIDEPPENRKVADIPRSAVPEPEAVSEQATIDLVFSAGNSTQTGRHHLHLDRR